MNRKQEKALEQAIERYAQKATAHEVVRHAEVILGKHFNETYDEAVKQVEKVQERLTEFN